MPINLRALSATAAVVCAVMSLALFFAPTPASAIAPGDVVISQVYGGGGNSGATLKNDFIELFNRSADPVDVTGWSVQYAAAGGTSWQVTALSATIKPGHYYLVQEAAGTGGKVNLPTPDKSGSIAMAAGSGKVALVSSTTALSGGCPSGGAIVDFVGFGSSATCYEGSGPTATLSNTTAALRNNDGNTDTDNNSADFTVGAPNPRNSSGFSAYALVVPGASCPAGTAGCFNPTVLLTVPVSPSRDPASTNITVTADLTAIGGPASQSLYDDGLNGDVTAGDKVFSFVATVAATILEGTKSLPVTVTDAQGHSAFPSISVNVVIPRTPLRPIYTIQGNQLTSSLVGQTLTTSGVVTAVRSDGFFLQDPQGDSDPATSDGIFVYTGGGNVPANAQPGNFLQVTGKVSEYSPSATTLSVTELGGTVLTQQSGTAALPAPVVLTAVNTPLTGNRESLEPYEGMLVRLDSITSVGPSGISGSSTNGRFYAVISPLARPFREPGIDAALKPAGRPEIPAFDGNPELLQVDGSRLTPPLEITSGVTLTDIVGVLDTQNFTIQMLSNPVTISPNIEPAAVAPEANREFTIATFNMLNFGADNILSLTDRIAKASLAIRNVLRLPDIIGVEEMKDGSTLALLAGRINADTTDSTQAYDVAFVGTTGDTQRLGLLVKTSRVTVLDVAEHYVGDTFIDPTDGNPKTIFDRAPIVLHATITPPIGQPFPVTVIVNHLRSFIDLNTKTPFVGTKRKVESEHVAGLIQEFQEKGEHVIAVGDYNAYQFNDGYVDVIGTILGTPAPKEQLYGDIYASADVVNPDLTDLVNTVPAAERYSYVENGNAQAIDHILVTQDLLSRPYRLEYGRIDADFPESFSAVATRPERLSDHDPAVAFFTFPPPQADLGTTISADNSVLSGAAYSYTITVKNNGPDQADNTVVTALVPPNTTFQSISAPAGWTCASTPDGTGHVSCTAASLAVASTAQFKLDLTVNCSTPDGTKLSDVAGATSDYADPISGNNTSSFTSSVSNPAPVISQVVADKTVLRPPNHKMVDVFLNFSATASCGQVYPSAAITSNQPLNGMGDGNTAVDWQVIDAHHVLLRAERAPDSKAGRTYTITVTATDSAGGATSGSTTVSVPR